MDLCHTICDAHKQCTSIYMVSSKLDVEFVQAKECIPEIRPSVCKFCAECAVSHSGCKKSKYKKHFNAKTTLAVKCKSDPHPYVLYALLFLHKEGYINLNTSNYNAMQTTRREPRRDGSTVLEPNFCSVSVGFLLLETD